MTRQMFVKNMQHKSSEKYEDLGNNFDDNFDICFFSMYSTFFF